MRSFRTVLAASAAVVAMTAGSTQALAAAPELDSATGIGSRSCDVSAVSSHGSACFRKDGDYFYLYGGNTGVRVVAQWRLTDGSRNGFIRWTPTERYTSGVKNKNFYEYKTVEFRFGICYAGQGCDSAGDAQWLTGWKSSSVD